MALIRVTPDNAVETVRDQVDGFRDTIAAAGRSPAFETLARQADDLSRVIASETVEVELLALDGIHPQWTGALARWLGVEPETLAGTLADGAALPRDTAQGGGLRLAAVRRDARAPGRRAGERTPPVLVVAHGSTESPSKEMVRDLVDDMRGRPLTLVLAPEGADWARAVAGLGNRETWMAKAMELEKLAGLSLAENLARPPWDRATRMACAWSVAGALASLERAFSVVLEKEERGIAAKKAALEKRAAHQGGATNPSEIVGEVRAYLQKQFDSFQKRVSAQLSELVAPHDGTLTREIDQRVEQLAELSSEKKPKFDVVTVPRPFERSLLSRVSETLSALLEEHWAALRQLLQDAEVQVENIIDRKAGPPVALHFAHLPEQRAGVVVQRAVAIQKPYRGEIARRGPMDYFMAARRYQMLFFMVFSAFGLSFIRSYREFTIPMGVLLLAFGLLNVVNAARKQRAEAEAKELGKARDGLRAELQRAMTEVQKNWEQAVGGHLAAQLAAALELVDGTVKAVAEQSGREAASNKELLQQQLRGLDGSQRKIVEGVRKAQSTAQDLENLGDQLIAFYGNITSPDQAAAAPARPGAAAAAAPGAAGAAARPPAAGAGGAAAAASAAAAAAAAKLQALGIDTGRGPAAAAPAAGAPRAAAGAPPAPAAGGPAAAAAAAAAAASAKLESLGIGTGGGAKGGRPAAPAPPAAPGDALAKLKAEAAERMSKARQGKAAAPAAPGATPRNPPRGAVTPARPSAAKAAPAKGAPAAAKPAAPGAPAAASPLARMQAAAERQAKARKEAAGEPSRGPSGSGGAGPGGGKPR